MSAAPTTDAALRARLAFRPLARTDFPQLLDWLQRPHVAEWWAPMSTLGDVEADLGWLVKDADDLDPERGWIVLLDGAPVAYLQCYVPARHHADGWWRDVHDPGMRGLDQFIGEAALVGRGIGSAMIDAFCTRLFADPAVTRVQVDPSPGNPRAIRAYEKAGFRAAGVQETPDGPALLMYRDRDA